MSYRTWAIDSRTCVRTSAPSVPRTTPAVLGVDAEMAKKIE
jgi:hypothetical protein